METYFFLAEVKRSFAEVRTEWTKKPLRNTQIENLLKNPDLTKISSRCHFLVWGARGAEFDLRIDGYLRNYRMKTEPNENIGLNSFLQNLFLPSHAGRRLGVPDSKFQLYIEFLEQLGSQDSAQSDDQFFILFIESGRHLSFRKVHGLGNLIATVRELVTERNQLMANKTHHQSLRREPAKPSCDEDWQKNKRSQGPRL